MTIQNITLTRTEVPSKAVCGPDCVCTCGKNATSASIDLRAMPAEERAGQLLHALESVEPGVSLDLIAETDPVSVLTEADGRFDGAFLQRYVEQGPDRWVVRLTHR